MGKPLKTILSFFNKTVAENARAENTGDLVSPITGELENNILLLPPPPPPVDSKRQRGESTESTQLNEPNKKHRGDFDLKNLERDPGLRPQMWTYPADKKDEVRRAYLTMGPYQLKKKGVSPK